MELVGVIHLLPLPAGPLASPGFAAVRRRALEDARALVTGGLAAAVVENLGDAPFQAGRVEPHVVSMMTAICSDIRAEFGDALALGINVLRNDAAAALAVAAAAQACFIRVNVHTGAAWTDQGLIQGTAVQTLRYRRELGLEPPAAAAPRGWLLPGAESVRIAADVHVKHASPAGSQPIDDAAADVALRGRADVVIVSGQHTGGRTDLSDVRAVRAVLPDHTLWVGSGVEPSALATLRTLVDGAIVGTWLHRDGDLGLPLDTDRVRWLVDALAG